MRIRLDCLAPYPRSSNGTGTRYSDCSFITEDSAVGFVDIEFNLRSLGRHISSNTAAHAPRAEFCPYHNDSAASAPLRVNAYKGRKASESCAQYLVDTTSPLVVLDSYCVCYQGSETKQLFYLRGEKWRILSPDETAIVVPLSELVSKTYARVGVEAFHFSHGALPVVSFLRTGRRISEMSALTAMIAEWSRSDEVLEFTNTLSLSCPALPGLPSFPVHRLGQHSPYRTLDPAPISDISGSNVGLVSQINAGALRNDIKLHAAQASAAVREIGWRAMAECIGRAADIFLHDTLEVGGVPLNPTMYCHLQSLVTGATETHCRLNMQKLHRVMKNLPELFENHLKAWQPQASLQNFSPDFSHCGEKVPVLGVHLPSNSAGVHQLWIPFLAFVPILLKPGSGEIFSPERLRAALLKAGMPPEALSIYPGTGVELVSTFHHCCRYSMMFGNPAVTKQFRGDPWVDIHGPGHSKIIIGADCAADWEDYLDLIVQSTIENGGRSCINASTLIAPKPYAKRIATALADILGPIEPLPLNDTQAQLAAYPRPETADQVFAKMLQSCREGHGEMFTTDFGIRAIRYRNCSFLRPVVAYFPKLSEPVSRFEFLAPALAVSTDEGIAFREQLGRTLVCTLISRDPQRINTLRSLREGPGRMISLLNEEPKPTTAIDQLMPLETNVIRFLFERRV